MKKELILLESKYLEGNNFEEIFKDAIENYFKNSNSA